MITQKKLEEMYDESIKIWSEIMGKEVEKKYTVILSNTKRSYGTCKHSKKQIQLSQYSLALMPEEKAMNTMLHEVLHMIFKGDGHRGNWSRYAEIFNSTEYAKKYGYITRVTQTTEELKAKQVEDSKYVVKCTLCGKEYRRMKISKLIKNPSIYRCGECNGVLERVK